MDKRHLRLIQIAQPIYNVQPSLFEPACAQRNMFLLHFKLGERIIVETGFILITDTGIILSFCAYDFVKWQHNFASLHYYVISCQ